MVVGQKHSCPEVGWVDVVVVVPNVPSKFVDRTNALPSFQFVWSPKVCALDHRLVLLASTIAPTDFGCAMRIAD